MYNSNQKGWRSRTKVSNDWCKTLCSSCDFISSKNNAKLFQQLEKGFKGTINWNKYQSEPPLQTRNRHLNCLIDPRFYAVNRLFVLSFENDPYRRTYKRYFLPTVEIKDCNVMIVGKKPFWPVTKKLHKWLNDYNMITID